MLTRIDKYYNNLTLNLFQKYNFQSNSINIYYVNSDITLLYVSDFVIEKRKIKFSIIDYQDVEPIFFTLSTTSQIEINDLIFTSYFQADKFAQA